MAVVGLDIGSVAAKGVMLDEGENHMLVASTGWSPRDAGSLLVDSLLGMGERQASEVDWGLW